MIWVVIFANMGGNSEFQYFQNGKPAMEIQFEAYARFGSRQNDQICIKT